MKMWFVALQRLSVQHIRHFLEQEIEQIIMLKSDGLV